jgi:hypothetical protein
MEPLTVATLVVRRESANWEIARRYAFCLLDLGETLMIKAITRPELLYTVGLGRDVLNPLLDPKPSERHPASFVAPIGAILVFFPAQLATSAALARDKQLGLTPKHILRASQKRDLDDVPDGHGVLDKNGSLRRCVHDVIRGNRFVV